MISKKKGMVLFLIAFMLAQIAAVPFMPRFAAAVEPTKFSPSSAPIQEETIDRIIETLGNEELMAETIDPLLEHYMKTGEKDDSFSLSYKGEVQVVLYIEPQLKISAIREYADVEWTFDAKLLRVVYASVGSPRAVRSLKGLPGVRYLSVDCMFDQRTLAADPGLEMEGIDTYKVRDVMGATSTLMTMVTMVLELL